MSESSLPTIAPNQISMIAATMDDIPDAVIAGLIMLVGVIIVFVVRHVVHSLERKHSDSSHSWAP